MWILILLVLVNGLADNKGIILRYRFDVGSLPVNMLDVLEALCLFWSILPSRQSDEEKPGPHSLAIIIPITFVLAAGLSLAASLVNDLPTRWVITPLRNILTLPLCVFVGYRMLTKMSQLKMVVHLFFWTSILSAVIALIFVQETAENIATHGNFDQLRMVGMGGDLGFLALMLIPFTGVSQIRFLSPIVRIPVLAICVVCTLTLPHRNLWLTSALLLAFSIFVLSKASMGRKLARGWAIGIVAAVSLTAGVLGMQALTGRDFGSYAANRLVSILPGEHEGVKQHPWETRFPGALRELELWLSSPLFGQGFGIQDIDLIKHQDIEGYRHNVWTATLAESGLIGFAGFVLLIFGTLIVGYRMVKDNYDRDTVLIGAVAALTGAQAALLSSFTMSINVQRGAIPIGLICGLVLKARILQRSAIATNAPLSSDPPLLDAELETVEVDPVMSSDPFHEQCYEL